MVHVWHLVRGGVWRRVEGDDWAHVGVGGCKTSWGEVRGGPEWDSPYSDNTVSLCRMSLNWSSHTSLWHCLFFQALIPPLSLSYHAISLILSLSPSSPVLSHPPSMHRHRMAHPANLVFPYPIFFLSHTQRLHYSWPKIISLLSSLYFPLYSEVTLLL